MTDDATVPKRAGNGPSPYASRIGARIRGFREAKGLSLSELSRHAAIAKGTLSALEGGRGNPTVMTLVALGRVLGLTPSDFLRNDENGGAPTQPSTDLRGPHVIMRYLTRIEGAAVWEIYEATLPQSAKPYRSQTHDGTEHLFVLAGTARVGPDGETKLLREGEQIAFDGSKPHSYHAPAGETRMLMIMEYPR
jgi:transcriptional regulator with XRE-family HTH domain